MCASKTDDELEIIEKPEKKEEDEEDDESVKTDESSSESGESGDEEEDEDVRKKVKRRFDKILSDLKSGAKAGEVKSGNLDLTNSAGVQTFITQNAAYLSKTSTKEQTLLHLIAEAEKDDIPPAKKMKLLITALVQLPDNLLAKRDENGKTPLFCAITNRNHRLVRIMCEAHHDVNSILMIPKSLTTSKSTNCIHQAITKKSSSRDDELIKFLIEKAEADTLRAIDENGFTPLHLAVEYKRCDEAQLEIVKALVERCDEVLDMTYKHPEKGRLSPYLYHELTYEEAKQKEKETTDSKRKADKADTEAAQKDKRPSDKDKEKEKRWEPSKEKTLREPAPQESLPLQPPRMAPLRAEAPTGKYSSKSSMPERSRGPLAALTTTTDFGKAELLTPVEKKKSSSKKTKVSKLKPTDASALAIKQYLKLEFLRKRNHDDAVEFLYGSQQDRQIYFDLVGVSPKVSKGRITHGLSHLQFEDILQYVAIPRVEVEDDPIRLKPGQRTPKPDGNGRTDMKPLFKWLRDEKKVKTTLKVIVDDLQEPAHSDDAIEACLAGMGVETWDWRKVDLSPEVIQKVAPDARIVHLYWSGNNAVLRGWSEPDGLKKLKKLEKVHLHVQQGLETRSRTKQNVAAFKERIKNGTQIQVEDTKLKGDIADSVTNGAADVRDPYERHKWMTSMEEFADFLQTAERNIDIEPPLALKHPVTVAIIDDGVDINDQTIQSKVIGGRSFCHRDEEQNLNQPYYVSGGGHGTAMAGLICKVCPNVRLYILRLDEYFIEPGKRQITAKSAARAVRAAVEKKVDIISMSWTIEKTDRNGEEIDQLEEAISLAARKNILMFCAATDQGAYKDRTYPAATTTKNIFKIGAAEASGTALKWIGDQTLVDFIFPGHKVVMERHDNPNVKNYTALTGSSVATALASALAAVILYCVQLAGTWKEPGRPNELRDYKALKNHERMKEAFSQIGTTKESENKYIMVWNRFTRIVKAAETESAPKDVYIEYIEKLAKELMREA
ncbi:hypothetical protein F5Y04DRAFT_251481 [Hypomontagnella monticulosa]|nr:hypothetical protein F5Y04DRAFT_251481 [Hypomontagnella monticulosa]